ncbi:hypothetical protein [Terrabacter sp. Root181]|uniref:hypothetical protein n=1 Tax=Terrabacter sp. Root181 TaxID=1736484 RepID=UPI0006FBE07E|nr:hypothetical protein [Terrabacter sp. Root181]KRB42989.1 hypothetical protein ASD90_21615 [Terrabacter sp. Root181]
MTITLSPPARPRASWLLDVFLSLRDAGLPLGIDEYRLALRALQAGFGLPDAAALRRLLSALWIKDVEEQRVFDLHFDRVMGSGTAADAAASDTGESAGQSPPVESTRRSLPGLEDLGTSAPATAAEIPAAIDDEVQAARAVLSAVTTAGEPRPTGPTSDYVPVTKRQMKQSWRSFRHAARSGPMVELDVEATVRLVGDTGVLVEPVKVARRVNLARLLVLVDDGGSMVPFRGIADRLIETARRGGRFGQSGVFYFHNCPGVHLYTDSHRQWAVPFDEAIAPWVSDRTGVLFFSDGGAARGGRSLERFGETVSSLTRLRQRIDRIAWINPMPKERWRGTTAADIATQVAMFELSRGGFRDAVLSLRGRVNPR